MPQTLQSWHRRQTAATTSSLWLIWHCTNWSSINLLSLCRCWTMPNLIVQIEEASICFHLRRCWTISNILIVQTEAASICFHLRRWWTISNILQGLQPGPGSDCLVCQLYWLLSETIILFHENWNGSITLEFAIWQWGLLELRNLLKNKRSDERNNRDFNKLLILHSMKVRTLHNSERIAAHQNNEADLPFKLFFSCYTN